MSSNFVCGNIQTETGLYIRHRFKKGFSLQNKWKLKHVFHTKKTSYLTYLLLYTQAFVREIFLYIHH